MQAQGSYAKDLVEELAMERLSKIKTKVEKEERDIKQTQESSVKQAQGSYVRDLVEVLVMVRVGVIKTKFEKEDIKLATGLEKVHQWCQRG